VPRQIEFARLNLTYVVLSKRKLIQLVDEKHVAGWDDPRLPTLVGARRRGFTAEGFKRFAERIGVSKADSWIDMSVLEDCMREDLNEAAERRVAVLDPLKLIITNYPAGETERCHAPNHPLHPELGKREMPFGRELWIEREDFMETPVKGYHRLYPGNMARLRYGYVVKCTGCEKDADGNITAVLCEYLPDSKSGTPGADNYKVKGNLHWVSVEFAYTAEVRLYDRLFAHAYPGARREGDPEGLERDFTTTSTRTACRSSPPSSNPPCAPPGRKPASSSSATATSSPTGSTPATARRCSTAPSRCATPGRNKPGGGPAPALARAC
jgi:glutaminyl-tRNA synthetase